MLTRDEAPSGTPAGAIIGTAAVFGPVPDDVLIALATIGIASTRDASSCDLVLADVGDAELARLIARGRPVIATTAAGDLAAAVTLARLGAVDVLTRPIQPDLAARKVERALRRAKQRSS